MPSRQVTALIMLLALSSLRACAQIVPVSSIPTVSDLSYISSPEPSPEGAGIYLPPPPPKTHTRPRIRPFSTLAMGLTAGTLGAGAELATPLSQSLNLRVGGSYVNVHTPSPSMP